MSDVTSFHVSSFCPCLFFLLTHLPDEAELPFMKGCRIPQSVYLKWGEQPSRQEWRPVSKAADPQARRALSCLTCCYSNLSASAVLCSSTLWLGLMWWGQSLITWAGVAFCCVILGILVSLSAHIFPIMSLFILKQSNFQTDLCRYNPTNPCPALVTTILGLQFRF